MSFLFGADDLDPAYRFLGCLLGFWGGSSGLVPFTYRTESLKC
jgi:hypothetical protein